VTAASGTPTGTVQYSDGVADLHTVTLDASGRAVPLQATLDVGSTVFASYAGDSDFAPSIGWIKPDIRPAPTSLTLTSDSNPQTAEQPVTIVATVANATTPAVPFGSVQFYGNGRPMLTGQALDDTGRAGIVARLPAGTYEFTAKYHDDTAEVADFVDSEGSLTQLVDDPPVRGPSVNGAPEGQAAPAPAPIGVTTRPETIGGPPQQPTNAVVVGRPHVTRDGRVRISAQTQDPGSFRLRATTRPKRNSRIRTYGTASTAVQPGVVSLTIVPNATAKAALARGRTLRLTITLTFESARGGSPFTTVLKAIARPRLTVGRPRRSALAR
jgi:hypothetical protein